MYFKWPIYVLFVGGAVNGTCGYFTTMILAVLAYVADTTDESDRAFRLGKKTAINLTTSRGRECVMKVLE